MNTTDARSSSRWPSRDHRSPRRERRRHRHVSSRFATASIRRTPMPREVVVDGRGSKPDHLDLIAERDGEPVGAASAAKFGGAPDGEFAYLTIRVVARSTAAGCRHGAPPARLRARARARQVRGFYVFVRHDDETRSATTGARLRGDRPHAGRVPRPRDRRGRAAARPPGSRSSRCTTRARPRHVRGCARGGCGHPVGDAASRAGTFEQWRDAALRGAACSASSRSSRSRTVASSATRSSAAQARTRPSTG